MTELFKVGTRILELGRRLLATPPLAELPPAYDALLRDPGKLLEETWGAAAGVGPASEEPAAFKAAPSTSLGREHTPLRPSRAGVAATVESASGGAPSSALNSAAFAPNALLFPARPSAAGSVSAQPSAAGPKAVPLRLAEGRPRVVGATEESVEGHSPETLHVEEARRLVEWPAARPAAGAALAAPGNARQQTEEVLEADPELQVLRGQLGEDEERRQRLQTERARESFREGGTEVRRGGDAPADFPAALTPTSFSPLTSLLSKNVARAETAPLPQVPEVLSGGNGSPWSGPGEGEQRAVAERTGGEKRDGDEAGRRASAPTVDEVLEELYERLRLEFSRTYGTTGG